MSAWFLGRVQNVCFRNKRSPKYQISVEVVQNHIKKGLGAKETVVPCRQGSVKQLNLISSELI